jgi:hypothetical protein
VDLRVQRLDAAAEDLGRAGVLADLDDGDAELLERGEGASGREHLHLTVDEDLRQDVELRLVADADEGAADGRQGVHGQGPTTAAAAGSTRPRPEACVAARTP